MTLDLSLKGMTETPVIKDSFATEARCFVAAWDRLNLVGRKSFADFPDAAEVRPLKSHSWYFVTQRHNPFRDHSPSDLWVIKLAEEFRRWCDDPGNPRWWSEMFGARWELHVDGYPWEFADDA